MIHGNLNINGAKRRSAFPTADLSVWYDNISSNEFTDKKESNVAKFLPSCFKGNDSAYYALPATAMVFDDNDFEIEFDFFTTALSEIHYICGAFVDGSYRWYVAIDTSGRVLLYTEYNDVVRSINTVAGDIEINQYYVIKIVINRGGTNEVIINESSVVMGVSNDILNFDNAGNKTLMTYATNYNNSYQCSYLKTTIGGNLAEHYLLPSGYDVSGNNRHATKVNAVAANTSYMLNASRHLNEIGYSLWEHATSDAIQVPYNLAGNPLSLTAGVNIPTGYTKILDIPYIVNKWNMADCLVGFNENESAATELGIFDRSNTTRQSAISRASDYYDDTNLATKSRYHIKEITNPRLYFEFFNVGHAGKIFGKVDLELIGEKYYFKYYEEQLVFSVDKTGATQFSIMKYCNIDVFAE